MLNSFRLISVLLALFLFALMTGGARAQSSSIQVSVKGPDGKPISGVEVQAERQDAKASVEVSKTDANGRSVFKKLALGTYKITALENRVPASVVTAKTKTNTTVAVNLGLKSTAKNGAAKKRKHAVWVPDETGSHIGSGGGGRWETVEDPRAQ